MLANVRSVINKRDALHSLIDTCDANIVALTETWLHDNIHDCEVFNDPSQFTSYRCDRAGRQGGGVLLAVSSSFRSYQIPIDTNLESVWACVELNYQKCVFGVCYRPPSYPSTFIEELHDVLTSVTTRHPTASIFLLGDFNYPSIPWSSDCPSLTALPSESRNFLDLCSVFSLSQVVKEPTRITDTTSNILDLVLTSRPDLTSPVIVLPGVSDHSVVSFDILFQTVKTRSTRKRIRDYNKANFQAINSELSIFINCFLDAFDNHSVDDNWNIFKNKVHHLIEKYIPARSVPCTTKAPWYNIHLKRLSNRKKRLYRAAKHTSCTYRWNAYKLANKAYASALKLSKKNFFHKTLPSILRTDPRKFWRTIDPSTSSSITLVDLNGSTIPEANCASVLNNIFCNNFILSRNQTNPPFQSYNYFPMDPVIVEPQGISKLIGSLKTSSGCGVDLINSKFLKGTVLCSSIILSKLFQQSLETHVVPGDWKVGKVVPLHKSGSKHSPLNYRPISLTSISCKLLEHVLYSQLVNFLESNSFFSGSQHGFRRLYSCETQLLSFTHKLHIILNCRSSADCVFLDFSKAFDKVCHKLLLLKLSRLNLDPNLLPWIEHFLSGRSQFVTANNHNSSLSPVRSGVPQGSVLGPLLFLIYINDLPNSISSHIYLFADDCVIVREITNDSDVSALQHDIIAVSTWCNTWLMELNTTKCKVMRVCRSSTTTPSYFLNGNRLEPVLSYKYLGIHINSTLTWSQHIYQIINNANRVLGYLRRNLSSAPSTLKLLLYKSLVRPKLEYAASVWDPCSSSLINAIELVQNNAARFIHCNYHRTASVTLMKESLSLPSLAHRRSLARLSLYHKIYHHIPELRSELLPPPPYVSSRLDHHHKVGIMTCHTNACLQSFIPRTSIEWNHLPGHIADILEHSRFCDAIASHLTPS